jgi:hypothetical protein
MDCGLGVARKIEVTTIYISHGIFFIPMAFFVLYLYKSFVVLFYNVNIHA